MFLFLASLACVAAAQCHDAEPHLQKRDWVDGDRHCSYRESVVFESFSREFDRLVGPEPKATALITGEAMALSAHEGAVFLEHGAEGEAAPCLLFTTKPYENDGRRVAAARDGELLGKIKLPGKDPAANLAFVRLGVTRRWRVGTSTPIARHRRDVADHSRVDVHAGQGQAPVDALRPRRDVRDGGRAPGHAWGARGPRAKVRRGARPVQVYLVFLRTARCSARQQMI